MRVLYLDLDCCRPDHLSVNGYHRKTSPNIDRIAEGGVTFTNCFCANSPCLPSRASLFSGRFGINNGVVGHDGPGERFRPIWRSHSTDPERPMVVRHLWEHGMKTVSFSSFHDRHNAWWFACGWEELYACTRKRGYETADEICRVALPWFRRHGREDNWFAHVHFWDIHSPYRIMDEWERRFRDDPPPAWPDEEAIAAHQSICGPRTALDLWTGYADEDRAPVACMPGHIRSLRDLKQLIDGYDGAIAYADHHVGLILNVLADLGVLDETAVVVSADHGDSFGEHGQYMDHCISNDAVTNVPMIVRWPGVTRRASSDALIYGMDLGPTLCELLGAPIPSGWDGEPFTAALRGQPFASRSILVIDHGIYTITRAVRTRQWRLIRVLHPGLYPYDDEWMLYDLRDDPHMARNVVAEQPQVVEELRNTMMAWRDEHLSRSGLADPLEDMVSHGPFLYYGPEQMLARLRQTGRSAEAASLEQRLSRLRARRV